MKYEISITKTKTPKERPTDESKLGFGRIFTDHMFLMDYSADKGWFNARIVPFGPIPTHPASTVFHYGAEIFEGMKAYRAEDGSIRLFRPLENVKRLNNSAERLCLPQIDEEGCLDILNTLVELEKDWVPHSEGTSLYLRPFLYGNDPHLGVHAVSNAVFAVICSPVGAYYATGLNPVSIAIESQDVRAVRGGTGYAKCVGNYAASLRAGKRAEEKGYAQVLWLDGVERKYIEEVGAMNVMFKIGGKIITPELTGSVLPGITRKSSIELLRSWGYEVEERLFSVDELFEAVENGTLEEAWGTGTAAVVSPIGHLFYNGKEYTISDNKIGALTQKLYNELTAIQWGKAEDKFGWSVKVCNG
ncbi:MAG: branched-chain amino acid aminotransferase [Acutalibacteraceae bacterium]|nr:branched-chain amino acid aminotransferase [Acutalibacteraceae bacterium]